MSPIDYTSVFSPLIGILRGFSYLRLITRAIFLILLLISKSFFTDIPCWILAKNGINNLAFIQLYGFLEGLLLLLFSGQILKGISGNLNYFMPLYVIVYISDLLFVESFFAFTTWFQLGNCLLFLIFCFTYLYQVFNKEEEVFGAMLPVFLAVIGVIFYFSGAFFSVRMSSDILVDENRGDTSIFGSWIFHNLASILKNIFLYTFDLACYPAPVNWFPRTVF